MARRKRVVKCEVCHTEPVRRGGRHWCAVCYGKMKRPKATCRVCQTTMASDLLVGRRCRPCMSTAAHAKRIVLTYGITEDEYTQLLVWQGGRCYICNRRPASKRLAVDHSHTTGAVRGLLCRNCNRNVLGHLREDVLALERAISYLLDPPASQVWPNREIRPDATA